tara:strand:+ start:5780 stop:6178 length:399 start_codon:yes stop_codon:yes gene_type:complete
MKMIQKILVGLIAGTAIGLFMSSFFLPPETHLFAIFWTKITSTAIITGFITSIYAYLSKSKFQVFIISIFIGIIVFYIKYWITGHHFDPGIMGAFTGALLGGTYAVVRKLTTSFKVYKRLESLRKKGFNNYY